MYSLYDVTEDSEWGWKREKEREKEWSKTLMYFSIELSSNWWSLLLKAVAGDGPKLFFFCVLFFRSHTVRERVEEREQMCIGMRRRRKKKFSVNIFFNLPFFPPLPNNMFLMHTMDSQGLLTRFLNSYHKLM